MVRRGRLGLLGRILRDSRFRDQQKTACNAITAVADAAWRCLIQPQLGVGSFLNFAEIRAGLCDYLAIHLERTARPIFQGKLHIVADPLHTGPSPIQLGELLRQSSGLAAVWTAQFLGWRSFVATFARDTMRFCPAINLHSPSSDVILSPQLSDPHHGGRSVMRVRFRRTEDWFYKPRNGKREVAWSSLLTAVNDRGFSTRFHVPEIRTGRDHHWMRRVATARGEIQRGPEFNFLSGAMLYLVHTLRAVDMHAANFIRHETGPVLIDCETLLHPETPVPEFARIEPKSLMRTGMLGDGASANGNPLLSLSNRGLAIGQSDGPGMVAQRDQVMEGFVAMHSFWRSGEKQRIIRDALTQLRLTATRYIYRPTLHYYRILEGALTSSLSTAELYSRLSLRLGDGLCPPRIVREEIRQLLRGDIPRFEGIAAVPRRLLTEPALEQTLAALRFAL